MLPSVSGFGWVPPAPLVPFPRAPLPPVSRSHPFLNYLFWGSLLDLLIPPPLLFIRSCLIILGRFMISSCPLRTLRPLLFFFVFVFCGSGYTLYENDSSFCVAFCGPFF